MSSKIKANEWSVLDRELSDRDDDSFGHKHFSDLLGDLIESPHHKPPYSVGLLGSWGTGKSSIKEFYRSKLKEDTTGEKGKKRKDLFHSITFNAWRYGGDEDLKRALLRLVFMELGGDDTEIRKNLYKQVSTKSNKNRDFWEWSREAILQNIFSVLIFLILVGLTLLAISTFVGLVGLSDQFALSALGIAGLGVSGFLAKYVVDIRIKLPSFFLPVTTVSFPATGAEEYENLLICQIQEYKKSKKGKFCERLVVFVDDLDRLSPSEMVSGLDAIRTFLELPLGQIDENFGVVFVISCDEDRIAEALAKGNRSNPDLPGSVITRSDARRYLGRLFQFRIEIPPFPKQDMRSFAIDKLSKLDSFIDDITSRGIELDQVVDKMIHTGVQSPRNAIQLINAFTQSWRIAIEREKAGLGSKSAGALYDGAVTGHPITLAVLCVLRVDFPDFYNELERRPELIQEFNKVVLRREKLSLLPPVGQEIFEKFVIVEEDRARVKPEFRALRQYLSSVQGLRWSKNLLPFLLLAENALTRQFGDSAPALYDALVSADTEGVLEIFGRNLDNRELSEDNVKLLSHLFENVFQDTYERRINAARPLAELLPRVPANIQRPLIEPLARQMIEIKSVRENVGPKAATLMIDQLQDEDQRDVTVQFVKDLLGEGHLDWRLPSYERPNLEQAQEIVMDATELALKVRDTCGLPEDADEILKKWLLDRSVESEAGVTEIPFSTFEKWMKRYSKNLLPLLGKDYADLAIIEFEKNPDGIVDERDTIERIQLVHDDLVDAGVESLATLWSQLTKMVAVKSAEAVEYAHNRALLSVDQAISSQKNEFIQSFAGRLNLDMTDEENWELDWSNGAEDFLKLFTQWQEDLETGTIASVVPLIVSWGHNPSCAEHMVRIYNVVKRIDIDARNSVIGNFVERPINFNPEQTLKVLAQDWETLSEKHRESAIVQMNTLINDSDVDEKGAERYQALVSNIPKTAWESSELQSHLDTLFSQLNAQQNNLNYVKNIFPVSKLLLQHASNDKATSFLQQLFISTIGAVKIYPELHRIMKGEWPAVGGFAGNYPASDIAKQGSTFVQSHPSIEGIKNVFDSVVQLGIRVLEAKDAAVITELCNAAIALWRQDPKLAMPSILDIVDFLSPSDITTILTSSSEKNSNSKDFDQLLLKVAESSTEERCIEISISVLSMPPHEIATHPDGAFRSWMKALKKKEKAIAKELLEESQLNDEQRERVFAYVTSQKKLTTIPFFKQTIPKLILRKEEPKTLKRVIGSISNIANQYQSADDRNQMVEALIPLLKNLSSDHLTKIANLLRSLGGKSAIDRSWDALEELESDQLDVMVNAFPESKVLKKFAEKANSS